MVDVSTEWQERRGYGEMLNKRRFRGQTRGIGRREVGLITEVDRF